MSSKQARSRSSAAASDPGAAPAEQAAPLDGVLRIYAPTSGPHATQLVECAQAYARGDFRTVRRLARAVCAGPAEADERSFAEELLRRTAIDPLALWTAAACLVLFWLAIYLTVWR